MGGPKRSVRVGESIREVLAEELTRGLKTPGVGFCTITAVEVTDDLRQATVFVSVYGPPNEQESTMAALGRASGYLRHEVAKALRTKVIPNLFFKLDGSVERGSRLSAAINEARKKDDQLARERGDVPPAALPATGKEASHGPNGTGTGGTGSGTT